MYKMCKHALYYMQTKMTPCLFTATGVLIISKLLVPSIYKECIAFFLLAAVVITAFSSMVAIAGSMADCSEESNWITQSEADNERKAYLIHCHRTLYKLNIIKAAVFMVILSALAGFTYLNCTQGNAADIAYGTLAFILFTISFAITGIAFASLLLSAFHTPWRQYSEYYN